MRKTISDVAARADVSIKTVSRVINNEPSVRPETKARVDSAIAALKFRPSQAARALRGAKSFQIALMYDDPSPYYVYQMQEGLRARCKESGFRLLIQPCDVRSLTHIQEVDDLISETRPDGVVLSPPVTESEAVLKLFAKRGIPVVRMSPGFMPGQTSQVAMDDVKAAFEITDHLIKLGHKRIGFVIGKDNHVSSAERFQGYREALDAANISFDETIVEQGQFDFTSGKNACRSILACADRPTAIFASNDDMAAGVLSAANELGFSVPNELSVAGFDDADLAQLVWPQLTTIRQPVYDLAYAAGDILISGHKKIMSKLLPYELVVRGSTAPPH
jgi:LacI family transcriptional regulator